MWAVELTKIIKELIKGSFSLEDKQRLLEANERISKLQQENGKLRVLVEDLQKRLDTREAMIFRDSYYWRQDDETPFCPKCWESEGKAVHLTPQKNWDDGIRRDCRGCAQIFWEKEPHPTQIVYSSGGISRWLRGY